MEMNWSLAYYRDIWEDDRTMRRKVYTQEPGEIIKLTRLVNTLAGFSTGLSYCVVSLNGNRVANYKRDAETGAWRETEL